MDQNFAMKFRREDQERRMQADFGAVSNVGATHDVAANSKPVKPKTVKRKSIDLHGANTSKFNPKLLEILNSNQDELLEEQIETANQITPQLHQLTQQKQHHFEHNTPQQIKIQQLQQIPQQPKQVQQVQQSPQAQTPQTPSSQILKPPNPAQTPIEPVIHHHYNASNNLIASKAMPANLSVPTVMSKLPNSLESAIKPEHFDQTNSNIHTNNHANEDPNNINKSSAVANNIYGRNTLNKASIKIREINSLPEKIIVHIFSFLNHHELIKCALVCKYWRNLTQNPKLWRALKLRPEFKDSIYIRNIDYFTHLLSHRFCTSLEYIELPIELITANILHELANRCTNLKYLTLDFSAAMQLQDFNDLNAFPCNLKLMTICLSEVIFLEGFMRRIYSFLSSLEVLHLIGTLETSNDPDESYETINITKIKAYTPNLRVISLYGITFIDDNHIESIASGCIHLEGIALNFCSRFKGYSLKTLLNRCKKLKSLILQNTAIESEAIEQVEWEQTCVEELDLSSTDLNEKTLLLMLNNSPNLTFLSVAYCDGFTNNVFTTLINNKKVEQWQALDLSYTVNLDYDEVFSFLKTYGNQLRGFSYAGNVKLTEYFWINSIKNMKNIKIVVMGTSLGWFKKIATRIHVDQIIESFAVNCPFLERLEIQWDPETIRFNNNSRKFIDHIRLKCGRLKSFVLSDGEYFEMVKSNFERTEKFKIVRTTTCYHTSIISLSKFFPQLLFN